MSDPNHLEDPTAAMEMVRQGIDANTDALNSILFTIRDACQQGIAENDATLKKIRTTISKVVNKGVAMNDDALNHVIGTITDAAMNGIATNEAQLTEFMKVATVGTPPTPTEGGQIQPAGPFGVAQFRLYIKCGTKQLGVFLADNDPAMLAQTGWTLASGTLFTSQSAAMQFGRQNIAQIYANVCRQGIAPHMLAPQLPVLPMAPQGGGIPTLPVAPISPVGSSGDGSRLATSATVRAFTCCCQNQIGKPFVWITLPETEDQVTRQRMVSCPCLKEIILPAGVTLTAEQWLAFLNSAEGRIRLKQNGCPDLPLAPG